MWHNSKSSNTLGSTVEPAFTAKVVQLLLSEKRTDTFHDSNFPVQTKRGLWVCVVLSVKRPNKGCCRVDVADDAEGKLVLVVWLDKRGRGLSGIMWLPKCQECLRDIVLKSATPRFSYVVRSWRKPFLFWRRCPPWVAALGRASSDFKVLLNAELGQGLFDA